jgi:hypothetical protein
VLCCITERLLHNWVSPCTALQLGVYLTIGSAVNMSFSARRLCSRLPAGDGQSRGQRGHPVHAAAEKGIISEDFPTRRGPAASPRTRLTKLRLSEGVLLGSTPPKIRPVTATLRSPMVLDFHAFMS